jgi:hypothetical protein
LPGIADAVAASERWEEELGGGEEKEGRWRRGREGVTAGSSPATVAAKPNPRPHLRRAPLRRAWRWSPRPSRRPLAPRDALGAGGATSSSSSPPLGNPRLPTTA